MSPMNTQGMGLTLNLGPSLPYQFALVQISVKSKVKVKAELEGSPRFLKTETFALWLDDCFSEVTESILLILPDPWETGPPCLSPTHTALLEACS